MGVGFESNIYRNKDDCSGVSENGMYHIPLCGSVYTEKYYIICRYWIPYLPFSRQAYILD